MLRPLQVARSAGCAVMLRSYTCPGLITNFFFNYLYDHRYIKSLYIVAMVI